MAVLQHRRGFYHPEKAGFSVFDRTGRPSRASSGTPFHGVPGSGSRQGKPVAMSWRLRASPRLWQVAPRLL